MANAWARRVDEGESAKAHAALMAYLELGAARSLVKACGVSTANLRQFEVWSSRWQWVERAKAFDLEQQRIADEAREAYIRKVMELRYADPYRRAEQNNAVVVALEAMIHDEAQTEEEIGERMLKPTRGNLWVRTPKGEEFNKPLVDSFLAVQQAMADDLGQRIKKTDVMSGGKPITLVSGVDLEKI